MVGAIWRPKCSGAWPLPTAGSPNSDADLLLGFAGVQGTGSKLLWTRGRLRAQLSIGSLTEAKIRATNLK